MKVCPDCAAEGNPDPQPIDPNFYRIKAKGYAGGYRTSTYCRRQRPGEAGRLECRRADPSEGHK